MHPHPPPPPPPPPRLPLARHDRRDTLNVGAAEGTSGGAAAAGGGGDDVVAALPTEGDVTAGIHAAVDGPIEAHAALARRRGLETSTTAIPIRRRRRRLPPPPAAAAHAGLAAAEIVVLFVVAIPFRVVAPPALRTGPQVPSAGLGAVGKAPVPPQAEGSSEGCSEGCSPPVGRPVAAAASTPCGACRACSTPTVEQPAGVLHRVSLVEVLVAQAAVHVGGAAVVLLRERDSALPRLRAAPPATLDGVPIQDSMAER